MRCVSEWGVGRPPTPPERARRRGPGGMCRCGGGGGRRRAVAAKTDSVFAYSIKQIQTFDKMATGTHTHWRMTINNPDETDMALIQQGYPDHIRQLVWTPEVGENGTPHIQAFIKMKRDCRLSHMRKLFPRGNFGFLDSSEYRLNSQRYAQKQDETAVGPSIITNGEPLITVDGAVREVARRIAQANEPSPSYDGIVRKRVQDAMVMEDPTYARIFVGSSYVNIWTRYEHLLVEWAKKAPTHTHTHTDDEQSVTIDIHQEDGRSSVLRSEAGDDDEEASSSSASSDSEDASSTLDDSSSESDSEESDCSTDGEQDDRLAGGEQRPAQQPNRSSGLRSYRATDFSWHRCSAAHR